MTLQTAIRKAQQEIDIVRDVRCDDLYRVRQHHAGCRKDWHACNTVAETIFAAPFDVAMVFRRDQVGMRAQEILAEAK